MQNSQTISPIKTISFASSFKIVPIFLPELGVFIERSNEIFSLRFYQQIDFTMTEIEDECIWPGGHYHTNSPIAGYCTFKEIDCRAVTDPRMRLYTLKGV
jgi:hypothetical protein